MLTAISGAQHRVLVVVIVAQVGQQCIRASIKGNGAAVQILPEVYQNMRVKITKTFNLHCKYRLQLLHKF